MSEQEVTAREDVECHCGRPVVYGFDGDPTHHRGMCEACDATRCDAYPMECPYHERGIVSAREDVEALAAALREAGVEIGYVGGETYREHVARYLLASSWLAAHDEGVRAAEREPRPATWM